MAALSVGSSQVLPTLNDPVSAASPAPRSLPAGRSFSTPRPASGGSPRATVPSKRLAPTATAISVSQAYTDQPLVVALAGHRVTLGAGAAPAAGVVYYLGDGAGDIVPVADIGTADKVLPLCLGIGSNKVKMEDRGQAGTLGKR